VTARQPQIPAVPERAPLPGMRVCRRPARCPYVAPERSLAADLATWRRALGSALPGDRGLVEALLGDITALAIPPISL